MLGTPAVLLLHGRNRQWQSSAVSSVDTGAGIGYLTRDGAGIGGADGKDAEFVYRLSGLNNLPASITRVLQDVGGRVQFSFTAAWRINVVLTSSTPTTLVDWTSTNDAAGIFHSAGTYDFRFQVALGSTSFLPTVRTITNGVASAWTAITGSFTTGPVDGTINLSRGGQAGTDQAILGGVSGSNRAPCHFHYLYRRHGTPLALNAWGTNGRWIDPRRVGGATTLHMGPLAILGTDQTSGGYNFVQNGSLANV